MHSFIKKIKSNGWFLTIFLSLVFIVGFGITFLVLNLSNTSPKGNSPTIQENTFSQVSPEPVETTKEGVFNVLFLGYGGGTHSGGGLTDSIIVAHIDSNTKKYVLISVPRDLMVQGGKKLNAEASVNGYAGTSSTITGITGLSMNNYVAVSFAQFTKMIDNLGGVAINVPTSFTDNLYPVEGRENDTCGKTESEINALKAQYSDFNLEKQFTCRYETISYQKGPANLNGIEALKFVRSRHGDNDFARSTRQFAVLKGILGKLISLKSLNKLDSTISSLFEMVKTDLTLGKIKTLIETFGDASIYTGTEIQLTTDNYLTEGRSGGGAYVLYPKAGTYDYSEIKSFIASSISN